jgi:hypothetical protein
MEFDIDTVQGRVLTAIIRDLDVDLACTHHVETQINFDSAWRLVARSTRPVRTCL